MQEPSAPYPFEVFTAEIVERARRAIDFCNLFLSRHQPMLGFMDIRDRTFFMRGALNSYLNQELYGFKGVKIRKVKNLVYIAIEDTDLVHIGKLCKRIATGDSASKEPEIVRRAKYPIEIPSDFVEDSPIQLSLPGFPIPDNLLAKKRIIKLGYFPLGFQIVDVILIDQDQSRVRYSWSIHGQMTHAVSNDTAIKSNLRFKLKDSQKKGKTSE